MRTSIAGLLALLVCTGASRAEVKPHRLISDHAVLQQGIDVPIWGTAKAGEKVTVKFQGQEVSTVAQDGKWMVKLKPLKAGGPFTMTIRGENTVEVKDLLVGEVWVCSGQSNMQFHLYEAANSNTAIAAADDPQLRLTTVPYSAQAEPQGEVDVRWVPCTPSNAAVFSAVGYFFGRDLRQARGVPVGLINSSWGGTPIRAWTGHSPLAAHPAYPAMVAAQEKALANYAAALAKFKEAEAQWSVQAEQAKAGNKPPPAKPKAPRDATKDGLSVLYNGMIAPLQPYAIRGVIWYQGENDNGNKLYASLFPLMIKNWRHDWGEGDFPFLFVQIAPFRKMLPELREAQLLTWQQMTNTAMVVITDCGEATNIHPKTKGPVGARLALAARALAYGEKIESSGPLYESMKVDGDKVVLRFQHVGSGLVARDGDLKGFTIAGADGKFVPAEAKIESTTVVVASKEVPQPVAVRYGWSDVPDVNLYNQEGLPATPFRTGAPTK